MPLIVVGGIFQAVYALCKGIALELDASITMKLVCIFFISRRIALFIP